LLTVPKELSTLLDIYIISYLQLISKREDRKNSLEVLVFKEYFLMIL